MQTLYLSTPGTKLNVKDGKFIVTKPDTEVFELPIKTVENILIFAPIQITSPALKHMLYNQIPAFFLSHNGSYFGKLSNPFKKNLPLLISQYKFYLFEQNEYQKIDLSKQLIAAKIKNSYILLRRWFNHKSLDDSKLIIDYENCVRILNTSNDINSIRAIEGLYAKSYFQNFRKILKVTFGFKNRIQHPPLDPTNSLLSFGYTLLVQDIITCLEVNGLDPYFGFMHRQKYNNPTLALDLMEELRSIMIDSLVVDLINHSVIDRDDFEYLPDKVIIKDKLKKIFLTKYQAIKDREYQIHDKHYTYYQIMNLKAENYKKIILQETTKLFLFTIK